MKIILASMGSEGDIKPMISLAGSLQESGHKPHMVVPLNGKEICETYHLSYHLINIDYRKRFQRLLSATFKERLAMRCEELMAQFIGLADVFKGADLVIGNTPQHAAVHVAEALNIPYYHSSVTVQALPSKDYPPPAITTAYSLSQNMPKWINQMQWWFFYTLLNRIGRDIINRQRKELGLEPVRRPQSKFKRFIVTVDKVIDTVPADVKVDYIQTDYWHLFEDTSMDQGLLAFIESGPPPVYFGLGSTPQETAEELTKILEEVVEDLGIRIILSKGWGCVGQNIPNGNIKVIEYSPHHKLFPLMSAVVHHGGSGTVHLGAWAGVPQLIVPQWADQYHHAQRVWNLEVGPRPILRNKLTAWKLKLAIQEAISNPNIAVRCDEVKRLVHKREEPSKILERLDI